MRTAVVSYSLTGNNGALAAAVAETLSAEHIRITEPKPRKTGTILLDVLLGRTPKTRPSPAALAAYDRIVLMGPVWMGRAATPLRAYLSYLGTNPRPFAFACISGGTLNGNPKLAGDLEKRAGAKPAALVDLHITDLLPPGSGPTLGNTGSYRLNGAEVSKLSGIISDSVKKALNL